MSGQQYRPYQPPQQQQQQQQQQQHHPPQQPHPPAGYWHPQQGGPQPQQQQQQHPYAQQYSHGGPTSPSGQSWHGGQPGSHPQTPPTPFSPAMSQQSFPHHSPMPQQGGSFQQRHQQLLQQQQQQQQPPPHQFPQQPTGFFAELDSTSAGPSQHHIAELPNEPAKPVDHKKGETKQDGDGSAQPVLANPWGFFLPDPTDSAARDSTTGGAEEAIKKKKNKSDRSKLPSQADDSDSADVTKKNGAPAVAVAAEPGQVVSGSPPPAGQGDGAFQGPLPSGGPAFSLPHHGPPPGRQGSAGAMPPAKTFDDMFGGSPHHQSPPTGQTPAEEEQPGVQGSPAATQPSQPQQQPQGTAQSHHHHHQQNLPPQPTSAGTGSPPVQSHMSGHFQPAPEHHHYQAYNPDVQVQQQEPASATSDGDAPTSAFPAPLKLGRTPAAGSPQQQQQAIPPQQRPHSQSVSVAMAGASHQFHPYRPPSTSAASSSQFQPPRPASISGPSPAAPFTGKPASPPTQTPLNVGPLGIQAYPPGGQEQVLHNQSPPHHHPSPHSLEHHYQPYHPPQSPPQGTQHQSLPPSQHHSQEQQHQPYQPPAQSPPQQVQHAQQPQQPPAQQVQNQPTGPPHSPEHQQQHQSPPQQPPAEHVPYPPLDLRVRPAQNPQEQQQQQQQSPPQQPPAEHVPYPPLDLRVRPAQSPQQQQQQHHQQQSPPAPAVQDPGSYFPATAAPGPSRTPSIASQAHSVHSAMTVQSPAIAAAVPGGSIGHAATIPSHVQQPPAEPTLQHSASYPSKFNQLPPQGTEPPNSPPPPYSQMAQAQRPGPSRPQTMSPATTGQESAGPAPGSGPPTPQVPTPPASGPATTTAPPGFVPPPMPGMQPGQVMHAVPGVHQHGGPPHPAVAPGPHGQAPIVQQSINFAPGQQFQMPGGVPPMAQPQQSPGLYAPALPPRPQSAQGIMHGGSPYHPQTYGQPPQHQQQQYQQQPMFAPPPGMSGGHPGHRPSGLTSVLNNKMVKKYVGRANNVLEQTLVPMLGGRPSAGGGYNYRPTGYPAGAAPAPHHHAGGPGGGGALPPQMPGMPAGGPMGHGMPQQYGPPQNMAHQQQQQQHHHHQQGVSSPGMPPQGMMMMPPHGHGMPGAGPQVPGMTQGYPQQPGYGPPPMGMQPQMVAAGQGPPHMAYGHAPSWAPKDGGGKQ